MKHLFKPALVAAVLLCAAKPSRAQNNDNVQSNTESHSAAVNNTTEKELTAGTPDDRVLESNPALKASFLKKFPSASQQQWVRVPKGFYVSFVDKGRKLRAGYDANGRCNYVIADCPKEQLPGLLRRELREKYSAYNLIDAIAINAWDQVTYQVVLEGSSMYLTLKCNNAVIETSAIIKKSQP